MFGTQWLHDVPNPFLLALVAFFVFVTSQFDGRSKGKLGISYTVGLDDVFRKLYSDHYQRARGFSIGDMIAVINRLTKKDYAEFFERFVYGTDVPDYDRIFGYADYTVECTTQSTPDFGFSIRPRSGGYAITGVVPNSPATAAELCQGDVITKANGVPIFESPLGTFAGKGVALSVDRGRETLAIPLKVGSRPFMAFKLVESATATQDQI